MTDSRVQSETAAFVRLALEDARRLGVGVEQAISLNDLEAILKESARYRAALETIVELADDPVYGIAKGALDA